MRRRICLVFQHSASFVETDLRILSQDYDVLPVKFRGKFDLPALARAVVYSDIAYSWFALGHATAAVALSRVLQKRSIVVAGGWDVVSMPEIGYGAMLSAKRRRRTTQALRRADLVLAVSESNRREILQWVDRDIPVVYHGVDTEVFSPRGDKRDEVVTVATLSHEQVIRRKGVDQFAEVARKLPDLQFTLVGLTAPSVEPWLQETLPRNVTRTGWTDSASLREIYRRAHVYAQLSAHEGFGLAVAESMACGCVPVVSDRGSLPEVVNGAGVIVPYGDSDAAAEGIRKALQLRGTAAAKRVTETFSLAQRRNRLLTLLEGLF